MVRLRFATPLPARPPLSLFVGLLVCAMWAPGCGSDSSASNAPASSLCVPNQCQVRGSLRSDGSCSFTNKADGTSCDDNNSCTLYDTCRAGVCRGGSILPDGASCDDKNKCTQNDSCKQGLCVGGNPLVCPQGDACHEGGLCDPQLGCTLKSYGPCIEGLASLGVLGCVQSDYYAPVTLGGSVFNLLLDSGSTTTAVASAACANCTTDPKYTPGPTATDQKQSATGTYGDGTGWTGKIYQDMIFAGTQGTAVTPTARMRVVAIGKDNDPQTPFFAGSTCASPADPNAYQGILGLGPTDLALNYTDSFLNIVAARGTLTYDAFAVSLCDVGGRMWFGGFDPAAATRAPDFTPMVTQGAEANYYAIAIDDILVGSTSVGLAAAALGPAIVDTGTGPYAMGQQAFSAVTGLLAAHPGFLAHFPKTFFTDGLCVASSQGAAPSAIDASLPPLTFTMPKGGVVGAMQVSMKASLSYLQPQQHGSQIVYCSTLAQSDATIWGAAMMRSQVLVFDREDNQVGFAPRASCGATLPVSG